MFCYNCGTKLGEGENFCYNCGAPVKKRDAAEIPQPIRTPAWNPEPEAPAWEPPAQEIKEEPAEEVPAWEAPEAPNVSETPAAEAPTIPEPPVWEVPKAPETPAWEVPKASETPAWEAPKAPETPAWEAPEAAETSSSAYDSFLSAGIGEPQPQPSWQTAPAEEQPQPSWQTAPAEEQPQPSWQTAPAEEQPQPSWQTAPAEEPPQPAAPADHRREIVGILQKYFLQLNTGSGSKGASMCAAGITPGSPQHKRYSQLLTQFADASLTYREAVSGILRSKEAKLGVYMSSKGLKGMSSCLFTDRRIIAYFVSGLSGKVSDFINLTYDSITDVRPWPDEPKVALRLTNGSVAALRYSPAYTNGPAMVRMVAEIVSCAGGNKGLAGGGQTAADARPFAGQNPAPQENFFRDQNPAPQENFFQSQSPAPQMNPFLSQNPAAFETGYRGQSGTRDAGISYGPVMPAEENQFNSGLPYKDYFKRVFEEAFPQYEIQMLSSNRGKDAALFIFRQGGTVRAMVEVISESSSVQAVRKQCAREGTPYCRFYYNHHGWWNTKRYVTARVGAILSA